MIKAKQMGAIPTFAGLQLNHQGLSLLEFLLAQCFTEEQGPGPQHHRVSFEGLGLALLGRRGACSPSGTLALWLFLVVHEADLEADIFQFILILPQLE